MRSITKAETKAIQRLFDDRPKDHRFKLVVIDGVAKVNTSVKTCRHSINGGPCIVPCNKMGSSKNYETGKVTFYWEDGQTLIRRAGASTIHDAWGDHQPFADIEEEVIDSLKGVEKHGIPYETILKYDVDTGALSHSVEMSHQASGEGVYPIGSARSMVWPEEPGCLYVTSKKGKAEFIPCPLHTVFAVLKKAREANPDPQNVAKQVLGFCLWPLKPADHELPALGEAWTSNDLHTWFLKKTAREVFNKKYRRMDSVTAGKKAFGYLMHKYPDADLYRKNQNNISIPDELRYEIQREDWLGMRRAGIGLEGSVVTHNGPNALRVYREITHSLLASCPHTTNPGDGFGSTVLAHLAIDQNLRERTSKKEDFSDDKSRVQIITGDLMPGSLYNSFDLDTRIWLLCGNRNCTKDCVQKKLFNIKRDVNNLRMLTIGMESLLRDHDSEMVSDIAITFEGTQEKRKAISGLEEDMWRTGHDIIREGMENRSKTVHKGHGPDQDEVLDGVEALNQNTTNDTGFSLDSSLIVEAVVDDLMVQHLKDVFTLGVVKEIDEEGGVHYHKVYGPHQVKKSKVKLKAGYYYDFKVRDFVLKQNAVTAQWVKWDKAFWDSRKKENKLLLKKHPCVYDRAPVEKHIQLLPESERDVVIAKFEAELAIIHARVQAESKEIEARRDTVDEFQYEEFVYEPPKYPFSQWTPTRKYPKHTTKYVSWTVDEFFKEFDYEERKPGR